MSSSQSKPPGMEAIDKHEQPVDKKLYEEDEEEEEATRCVDSEQLHDQQDTQDSEEITNGTMLKRLRLRRSSDGSDDMERNEHGLVTRMRRSFKKSSTGTKTTPTKPMFATVCANNVNRSMEAHLVLQEAGLRVCSFGASGQVCFPGRTAETPREFGFGTPYQTMYEKLREEDGARYEKIGVLKMLERNMAIKRHPQRFQSLLNKQLEELDVVVCFDYVMFIQVLNDLRMRLRFCFQQKRIHIICLDVEDTPEDAQSGGVLALELCQEINDLADAKEDKVKDIVVRFEKRHKMDMFYVGLSV